MCLIVGTWKIDSNYVQVGQMLAQQLSQWLPRVAVIHPTMYAQNSIVSLVLSPCLRCVNGIRWRFDLFIGVGYAKCTLAAIVRGLRAL